jgi:hypothetical protein
MKRRSERSEPEQGGLSPFRDQFEYLKTLDEIFVRRRLMRDQERQRFRGWVRLDSDEDNGGERIRSEEKLESISMEAEVRLALSEVSDWPLFRLKESAGLSEEEFTVFLFVLLGHVGMHAGRGESVAETLLALWGAYGMTKRWVFYETSKLRSRNLIHLPSHRNVEYLDGIVPQVQEDVLRFILGDMEKFHVPGHRGFIGTSGNPPGDGKCDAPVRPSEETMERRKGEKK